MGRPPNGEIWVQPVSDESGSSVKLQNLLFLTAAFWLSSSVAQPGEPISSSCDAIDVASAFYQFKKNGRPELSYSLFSDQVGANVEFGFFLAMWKQHMDWLGPTWTATHYLKEESTRGPDECQLTFMNRLVAPDGKEVFETYRVIRPAGHEIARITELSLATRPTENGRFSGVPGDLDKRAAQRIEHRLQEEDLQSPESGVEPGRRFPMTASLEKPTPMPEFAALRIQELEVGRGTVWGPQMPANIRDFLRAQKSLEIKYLGTYSLCPRSKAHSITIRYGEGQDEFVSGLMIEGPGPHLRAPTFFGNTELPRKLLFSANSVTIGCKVDQFPTDPA